MNEAEIINEWLEIAYQDYSSAKFLYDNMIPKPLEIICDHCQQAAEKSLKAYLCAIGVDIPKTHEVKRLCDMCAETDTTFSELFSDCEELEVYATETRYPLRIDIDDSHAERALKQALKVYGFSLTKTQDCINGKEKEEK
jgi:HEPN domain-containing protein